MNKLVSLAAIFAAVSAPAFAADAIMEAPYVAPEVATGSNWDGFYLGIIGGAARSNREGCLAFGFLGAPVAGDDFECDPIEDEEFYDAFDYDQEGGLIGLQAGVAMTFGEMFLLGAEVDASLTDITGRLEYEDMYFGSATPGTGTYNYLATATLQAGVAMDAYKVYVEGGMALAGFDFDGDTTCEFDDTVSGAVLGVGAAAMVTENVSIGAEYNHIWMGSAYNTCAGEFFTDVGIDTSGEMDTVKLSANYHFE